MIYFGVIVGPQTFMKKSKSSYHLIWHQSTICCLRFTISAAQQEKNPTRKDRLKLPLDTRYTIKPAKTAAPGNVSRGGTSATQRQKFHTHDVDQYLHNKSGSHGVPNAHLFDLTFHPGRFWLSIVFICEPQMLPLEKNIFQKYWLFCYRFIAFTFDLCSLRSFVCHS